MRKNVPKTPRPPSVFFVLTMMMKDFWDWICKIQIPVSEPIHIDPKECRVWMVGHSTVLINLLGTVILTDPVLTKGLPFPRRLLQAGYSVESLPPLDVVAVSHAHMDHFNKKTLRMIASKTKTLIIPRNCADLVKKMPFKKVIELDWEKNAECAGVKIRSVRPVHWGERFPWEKKNHRGFNAYLFEKNGVSVFFAGDTAYGEFFKKVSDEKPVDLALLPIGAYKPIRMRAVHMNPEDALLAFLDLKAAHMVPIHWGSFRLSLEPFGEPPEFLERLALENGVQDQVHVLHNGQSYGLGL